jgi:hypothetical protein
MPPEKQVDWLLIGDDDPEHYGVLSPAALEHWKAIGGLLAKRWSNPVERERVDRMAGCLDKLSAALLQVARLRGHHHQLVEMAKQELPRLRAEYDRRGASEGAAYAVRGIEVLADFEGLLLQGRSALDRLTWFATSDFGSGSRTQSFRKLRKVTLNFSAKRPEAPRLLRVLDVAEPWFDAVFAKIASAEALRDLVGHRHFLGEGVETCLAVSYVPPAAVLLLDCEIRLPGSPTLTPILEAGRAAGQFLSYTVLNSVGIFAGAEPLEAGAFAPTWDLSTVARSQYLVGKPAAPGDPEMIVARRFTVGGFQMNHDYYRPELWSKAIKLDEHTA